MAEQRRGEQGAAPKPRAKPHPDRDRPWFPKPYLIADASAIKNLVAGTATAEQQRRGIGWIVNTLCATYDMSYRPGGDDGRRDSDFAEGMRCVGSQIIKLANIDISRLPRDPQSDPHEPG